MDVHKNSISTGVLEPGSMQPLVDKISSDDEMVRRLVGRFPDQGRVWACYEAGVRRATSCTALSLRRGFAVR
jgi:hypothetical protein